MSPEKLRTAVNQWQQRHKVPAFAYAINKKYGDDRGGSLAALIAYYGFLSIFPLLLAFFTIVSYTLDPHGSTVRSLDRHLGTFPVLGTSIVALEHSRLKGSALALVVGILGLVWGSMGLAQTLQFAMNEIWNIPGKARAGFLPRLLQGLLWYVVFGVGVVASTFVNSLGKVLSWGTLGPELAALPAMVLNVGLFVLSFRVLTPRSVPMRRLVLGAAVGGVVWTVLTTVGLGLVTNQLRHSSSLYGTFGTTLGLVGFLYLVARLSLYAAELDVVRANHLWPRSLGGPDLVHADRQQLTDIARREERVQAQTVTVKF